VRKEVRWWQKKLQAWNGKSLIRQDPTIIIEGDASGTGYGTVETLTMEEISGKWSKEELKALISSNRRELQTVLKSVQGKKLTPSDVIQFHSDNLTTVSYINCQGGRIPELNRVAQQIWSKVTAAGAWIEAVYLPGRFQIIADPRSRQKTDRSDYTLTDKAFNRILEHWDCKPTLDLFATQHSAKVPRFVSWKPDPQAVGTDAFQSDWLKLAKGGPIYANPPFSLIQKTLQRLMLYKEDLEMLLITPDWKATWWPLLQSMAIGEPLKLGPIEEVVFQAAKGAEVPDLQQPQLLCWKISAKSYENVVVQTN